MPTTAQNTFSVVSLQPYCDPEQARTLAVKLDVSLTLARGTVLAEKVGTNAIHTVTISGVPTGGTFTLTFGGQTTGAIAFGASADTVQAALEALSSIGQGNVKVTGGWNNVGAVFTVEYVGALGAAAQTTLTCSIASLTGGTAAQATASAQTGAAGSPGTFGAYLKTATNGLQIPKCVLQYGCTTDASGNVTVGGGEHGETSKTAPAFFSGTFLTADLTGLNFSGIAAAGWRLVSGTVASGIVRLG
jgi:hypothetical protein